MPLVNICVCSFRHRFWSKYSVLCNFLINFMIAGHWEVILDCSCVLYISQSFLIYTQVISFLYQAMPSILSKYTRWPCSRVDMYHFIIFWLTFDTFNLVEISLIMHLSLLQNAPFELYYQVSNSRLWRRCF